MQPTKIITAPPPIKFQSQLQHEAQNIYTVKESERKQAPTAKEISELKIFLMQFKIFVNVPNFSTHRELDNFRRKMLSAM